MIFGSGKEIAAQLTIMNAYLQMIADALQNPSPTKRAAPPSTKVSERSIAKLDWPPALVDASELLARWLWLQLPESSKKDMQA